MWQKAETRTHGGHSALAQCRASNPTSAAIPAAVSGLAPARPGHGCTRPFIDFPTQQPVTVTP